MYLHACRYMHISSGRGSSQHERHNVADKGRGKHGLLAILRARNITRRNGHVSQGRSPDAAFHGYLFSYDAISRKYVQVCSFVAASPKVYFTSVGSRISCLSNANRVENGKAMAVSGRFMRMDVMSKKDRSHVHLNPAALALWSSNLA